MLHRGRHPDRSPKPEPSLPARPNPGFADARGLGAAKAPNPEIRDPELDYAALLYA